MPTDRNGPSLVAVNHSVSLPRRPLFQADDTPA